MSLYNPGSVKFFISISDPAACTILYEEILGPFVWFLALQFRRFLVENPSHVQKQTSRKLDALDWPYSERGCLTWFRVLFVHLLFYAINSSQFIPIRIVSKANFWPISSYDGCEIFTNIITKDVCHYSVSNISSHSLYDFNQSLRVIKELTLHASAIAKPLPRRITIPQESFWATVLQVKRACAGLVTGEVIQQRVFIFTTAHLFIAVDLPC